MYLNLLDFFFQSFINQNAFIITHFPAPGDVVDFLRLITDHDCELVVSMGPLHEVESVRLLHYIYVAFQTNQHAATDFLKLPHTFQRNCHCRS